MSLETLKTADMRRWMSLKLSKSILTHLKESLQIDALTLDARLSLNSAKGTARCVSLAMKKTCLRFACLWPDTNPGAPEGALLLPERHGKLLA